MTLEELNTLQQRRAWAKTLKPGDVVRPRPLWNETERWARRRLPAECMIEEVRHERGCQFGVMLVVHSITGHEVTLSAGWFVPVDGDAA